MARPEVAAVRSAVAVRLSLDDAREPPRERFVLGGCLVPFAKSSVLFGPMSVGKSALAAQLVVAFAAGAESLWGLALYRDEEFEEYGGPVFIYSAEDSLEDWQRKVAALLHDGTLDVARALERLYLIDKSEGLARFSELVTEHTASVSRRVAQPTEEQGVLVGAVRDVGARLVLVETASRLVEEEDNANFAALQAALGSMARQTGAAFLATHHPTKAATKENDSDPMNARGGGSFVMNARSVLSLFPADEEAAKPWCDRFCPDDLVVLAHGKPTSSSRRHPPVTLVRCDARHGAVFRLPGEVALTPEQEQANVQRLERDRDLKWERLRRLYAVVGELLKLGPVSPSRLREHVTDIGVPKRQLDALVNLALERHVLEPVSVAGGGRGVRLGLGHDPRNAINAEAG